MLRKILCAALGQCPPPPPQDYDDLENRITRLETEVEQLSWESWYGVGRDDR